MDEETTEELKLFIAQQIGVVSAEVRELRCDIKDMHTKFSDLQSSVDHFVVGAERVRQEQLAMGRQMARHERWLKQLAEKTGIELDYAA